MYGTAARVQRKVLRRLSRRTKSQSSAFISQIRAFRLPPTLFTRMSIRPKRSMAASMSRAAGPSSVRSPTTVTAVPPLSVIAPAVPSSPAPSTSPRTAYAPSLASTWAISRPRPLAAPVTTATRSLTPGIGSASREDSGATTPLERQDLVAIRCAAGHFHPRRADRHSRHGEARHLGPLGKQPVDQVGRHVTFHDVTVDQRGVAGLHRFGHSVLLLHGRQIRDVLYLGREATVLEVGDPERAAPARWRLVHGDGGLGRRHGSGNQS